ncbi:TonB-dependent receptor [Porticoccaceae bacterium LTM1]|nr:TonB-dependent receptor [Porticoccaceae bacterium LTM1]
MISSIYQGCLNYLPGLLQRKPLASCLTIVLALGCEAATASDDFTEEDLLAGIPTVITPTRLPQSVAEAPVSVTVIDQQLIRASGAVEVYDLLRLVPGMQVGMTFRHHYPATTYHGQSDGLSRRMQVLVDGRVALGSQFGIIDWDRLGITVHDIERIEVVRGPASATYGSNSFVGVINVITRDPATAPDLEVTSSFGSQDQQLHSLRYSHSDVQLDYQLGLTYFTTEGFDGVNDQVEAGALRFKGHYQFSPLQSLDWQMGHAEGPAGRGGGGIPVIDPVGEMDVNESHLIMRWNQLQSPQSDWYAQFSYNRNRTDDRLYLGTVSEFLGYLPEGIEDEPVGVGIYDFHSERLDFEFKHTHSPSDSSRLVYGAGVRKNSMKGVLAMQSPDYYKDYSARVFANWEQRNGNWLFNVGGLFEDGDLASGNRSFRLGANYQFTPDQTFRASYSEGMRSPTMGEAFNGIGVKTLSGQVLEAFVGFQSVQQPEKITSYELGYVGSWLDGKMNADVKLFHEAIDREISEVLDPTVPELVSIINPGSFVRIDAGETHIHGAEINIDYKPWQGGRLWAAYSYTPVEQDSIPGALRAIQQSPATPRDTAALSLSHEFGEGWQASLNYYYLGEMAWQVWGADLDSYDRIDGRVARDFTIGRGQAQIELIGQNLFGSSYHEFNPTNDFDRRIFVRFSLRYD